MSSSPNSYAGKLTLSTYSIKFYPKVDSFSSEYYKHFFQREQISAMSSINNLRILATALCLISFIFAVQGFSATSSTSKPISIIKNRATHSTLFNSRIMSMKYTATRTPSLMMTELRMTEEKDDDSTTASEVAEATNAQTKSSKKERNGFITALILGPPLIFKFGIVLVVKFLTDLVVFPLLYLYRLCRLAKNKVVGLFVKSDDMKGDKVNGAGSS